MGPRPSDLFRKVALVVVLFRVGHGSLFQNPTQNFCTQRNPQKSSPDPTQPIIDTWYGILGYTENFIQQLLHVTDKFAVRS